MYIHRDRVDPAYLRRDRRWIGSLGLTKLLTIPKTLSIRQQSRQPCVSTPSVTTFKFQLVAHAILFP